VNLEAAHGVTYTPWLRWLLNPEEQKPEMWAWGYAEWKFTITPYPNGGPIGTLASVDLSIYSVLVSLTLPPGYKGWWLHAGPGDPDDPETSGTGMLRIVS
jgi:hypothetical protein